MKKNILLHLSHTSQYKNIFFILTCLLSFSLALPMLANNVMIIVLGVTWLAGGDFRTKYVRAKSQPLLLLFLGLFFILLLGLLNTQNHRDAGFRIEKSIPLLLLPLILFTSAKFTKNELISIMKFFVAGCLCSMVFCLLMAVYKNSLINYGFEPNIFTIELTFPIDISHVYFGMYLVFAIISTVYIYIQQREKYHIFQAILVVAFMIAFMLTITAKISFLSLIIITVTIGCLTLDLKKYWIRIAAGLILFFFLIFILYKNIGHIQRRLKEGFKYSYSNIENNKKNYSSTRMGPLKCSLELIRTNWLFGVGTGDNGDAIELCYKNQGLDQLTGLNSHNEYLDYFLTFGIGGLALLLACLFVPLSMAFRQKQYLYASFLLLFILCNLTENMLLRNKGIVFYAFFNSLFAYNFLNNYDENFKANT